MLKKLRKTQKSNYGEDFRKYIPHCYNFGMVVLANFENKIDNKDDSIDDSRLFGYIIMKRY